jgi:hypothetical protein
MTNNKISQPRAVPDHMRELAAWRPAMPKADGAYTIYGVPIAWRDAIEITNRAARRPQDVIVSYCLLVGVPRLRDHMPGIKTLALAREMLQGAGDDDAASAFREWAYSLDAGVGGSRKLWLTRLYLDEADRTSGELAQSLGLPRHVIDTLAIAAVLMEAAPVPQATREHMAEQLRQFQRRVRARADRAMKAALDVWTNGAAPTSRQLDFVRDVILSGDKS